MELSTSQFWAAFFAAVNTYNSVDLDPGNVPQNDVKESYDFIIVGGGTAGCVLANRLTENSSITVLLIEDGGPENAVSDTPLLEIFNRHTERDWNYTTVEQKNACRARGGICEYPRGHVLGGSSTINGMMYVRGNKLDYDQWVELGCTGWSYKDVLPYFIKSERTSEPELAASTYHGTEGYQSVQYARYVTPLYEEYIKAGEEFGWKNGDFNGKNQNNIIGKVQFTMDGPNRASASKAYLLPVRERKNLHIMQHSFVSKVIIDKTRAKGVEYHRDGQKHTVYAKKEVILSAGSIDTPKLLMLSGIGPKEELEKHNIDVIADLPVGIGLHDHFIVNLIFKINKPFTITTSVWKTNESIVDYTKCGEGPLTTTGGEAMVFYNPFNKSDTPTFQTMFHSFLQGEESQNENLITVTNAMIHPLSRGSVKLKSSDFKDPPLIDPNYLSEKFDYDQTQKGLNKVFEFMKTPTMSKYSPILNTEKVNPKCTGMNELKLIDCLITKYSQTVYHPVSTAKMGHPQDKNTVVSPNLIVKGFENLRVIDASVMPIVPRGNTNGPTLMVAEKGADIVKQTHGI